MEKDSFITIKSASEAIYKEKGSKFLSFAIPINSEDEADEIRKKFKKKYYDATHVVYAFRIGYDGKIFRAADDGEPSGSSGIPVLNQLRSAEITNVIVLVVRYFGGTKLGIPGLINAYGTAAAMALNAAEKIEQFVVETVCVSTSYNNVNFVMRIVKENNLKILEMDGSEKCNIKIEVRKNLVDKIVDALNANGKIVI